MKHGNVSQAKIKYAFMTTVDASMTWFMIPAAERMDSEEFDITLMCHMTDEFYEKNSVQYHCERLDLARGFHLGKTIAGIFHLYRKFKAEKYDVIDYATENVALCASIAGWLARVPVRVYNHWGARYVGYTGATRLVSKMIERIAALFSTDVRQVSPKNMEMCVADRIYPAKKVKVLGYGGTVGVDCEKFDLARKEEYRGQVRESLGIAEDAFVFGFIGRIQMDKGVNELLSAFRHIVAEDASAVLLMIGQMEDESTIEPELLEFAKSSEQVVFTGRVSDVYRYVSAFDVMVHPSYREGFGMVLQEAGAMKTPIITTDILGPSEFITNGENGVLVPPKDTVSLEEAMRLLKADSSLRTQYAQAVYEHTVNNFERSVMVDRMIRDRKELLPARTAKKRK